MSLCMYVRVDDEMQSLIMDAFSEEQFGMKYGDCA